MLTNRLLIIVFAVLSFLFLNNIYLNYQKTLGLDDSMCGDFIISGKGREVEPVRNGVYTMTITWPIIKLRGNFGNDFALRIYPDGVDIFNQSSVGDYLQVCRDRDRFIIKKPDYI